MTWSVSTWALACRFYHCILFSSLKGSNCNLDLVKPARFTYPEREPPQTRLTKSWSDYRFVRCTSLTSKESNSSWIWILMYSLTYYYDVLSGNPKGKISLNYTAKFSVLIIIWNCQFRSLYFLRDSLGQREWKGRRSKRKWVSALVKFKLSTNNCIYDIIATYTCQMLPSIMVKVKQHEILWLWYLARPQKNPQVWNTLANYLPLPTKSTAPFSFFQLAD